MENEREILHMCNTSIVHPNKDVHVYFERVVDDKSNIVVDVLYKVVLDQVKNTIKVLVVT